MNRGDGDNRLSCLILGVGARRLDGVLPRLEGEADRTEQSDQKQRDDPGGRRRHCVRVVRHIDQRQVEADGRCQAAQTGNDVNRAMVSMSSLPALTHLTVGRILSNGRQGTKAWPVESQMARN